MEKRLDLEELLLLSMDTALWRVNCCRSDVLAESVFVKLGGATLAREVNSFPEGPKSRPESFPSEELCPSV